MSRQDANAAFALTSFLYGGNARYIEDLYARYEADPAAVDAEWRSFFQSLKDDARDVAESARGASWARPGWPPAETGELAQALGGEWAEAGRAIGGEVKAQAQTKGVALSCPGPRRVLLLASMSLSKRVRMACASKADGRTSRSSLRPSAGWPALRSR